MIIGIENIRDDGDKMGLFIVIVVLIGLFVTHNLLKHRRCKRFVIKREAVIKPQHRMGHRRVIPLIAILVGVSLSLSLCSCNDPTGTSKIGQTLQGDHELKCLVPTIKENKSN